MITRLFRAVRTASDVLNAAEIECRGLPIIVIRDRCSFAVASLPGYASKLIEEIEGAYLTLYKSQGNTVWHLFASFQRFFLVESRKMAGVGPLVVIYNHKIRVTMKWVACHNTSTITLLF